jgi:adenylate cyclase, class 2
MRKEIEVKAKVENLNLIMEKLIDLGCDISEAKTQDDQIYVNFTTPFNDFAPGKNFLRIRKSGGKVMFTLKQPQLNELDCIEKEVEISSAEEMHDALLLMGYHLAVKVNKLRRKTNYNDCEICLDEVADLGTYIEIEKITSDEEDAEEVQKELFKFLETLGVSREDRVVNGYDTLIYLKNSININK